MNNKFETVKMTVQKTSVYFTHKHGKVDGESTRKIYATKNEKNLLSELDGIYGSGEHCSMKLLADDLLPYAR